MVKVYPEALPNRVRSDPKRSAEVRLYDELRRQLPDGWIVFYSVAWLGRTRENGNPQDAEADFIVAHPKHGVLLIEVKGGRISYSGARRQWISTDREGNNHDIDPFNQVMRSKHALLHKLKSLPRWSREWITLGHAVALPQSDISHIPLPPEASADIIIDGNDLARLAERIPAILAYWNGQAQQLFQSGTVLIADLEKLLAPTISLPNPLSLEVKDEEREILRLTEEQFHLLDFLSRTRRAAMSGCAGSGKTTLAVEKAKRLAQEGFRTLLTCYNKSLALHLTEVIGKREHLTICTFDQLCYQMARDAKLPPPSSKGVTSLNMTDRQLVSEDDFADVLINAVELRPDLTYDAIVVDEGQDFPDTWWLALEACLSARQNSIFYVFYDDNQRVYPYRGSIPADLHRFPLTENVRNTRTIHRALVAYYQGESPSFPRGPVGRSIEIQHYETEAELRKLLYQQFQKLIDAERLASSDIVVLTPRPLDRSVLPTLKMNGNYKLVEHSGGKQREVLYTTIQNFKGLERRVVIIVELDEELLATEATRDALCYVAFSRPRNYLILLGKQGVIKGLLPSGQ